MKIIAPPEYIGIDEYNQLTNKIIEVVNSECDVLSIYQMGSVKDPGISDLDIICVFKNGAKSNLDIKEHLNNRERKILTHSLFCVYEEQIEDCLSFNLISNLKLLNGKNLNLNTQDVSKLDTEIKTQIALEYLIKMYITLDAQLLFGMVKLRSFLLLAKAIKFDLELLGIHDGKLYSQVLNIITLRSQWFTNPPDMKDLQVFIKEFHFSLETQLQDLLKEKIFYAPSEKIKLPGNFQILNHYKFGKIQTGFILPIQFSFIGKKYINIQNRFNRISYYIPLQKASKGSLLDKRFNFYFSMMETNRIKTPHFMPLTTSLGLN